MAVRPLGNNALNFRARSGCDVRSNTRDRSHRRRDTQGTPVDWFTSWTCVTGGHRCRARILHRCLTATRGETRDQSEADNEGNHSTKVCHGSIIRRDDQLCRATDRQAVVRSSHSTIEAQPERFHCASKDVRFDVHFLDDSQIGDRLRHLGEDGDQ